METVYSNITDYKARIEVKDGSYYFYADIFLIERLPIRNLTLNNIVVVNVIVFDEKNNHYCVTFHDTTIYKNLKEIKDIAMFIRDIAMKDIMEKTIISMTTKNFI